MLTEPAESRSRKPLLAADRPEPAAPIPFDRRRHPRSPSEGTLMAAFVCDRAGITLARVERLDTSRHGAGLRCPLEIEPGTRFSLQREGSPLSNDRGVVARCTKSNDHYTLGLMFEDRLDAAA
jgi:hypothetical protein